MRKTKHTLAAAAAALLLLASCGGENIPDKQREEAPHTEQSAASGEHSGEIVLAPDKAKAAGVRTEKVTAGAFCGVLTTGGKIMEAPGQEVTLVAPSPGTVSFARPLAEGTKIAAGSTVFTISGRHMQDGDPAERARIAYRTAREDYERAARLAEDKIVSAKELNALRAAYETARTAYEAVSAEGGRGSAVTSGIGGYVKACLVKEGDYVTAGQPLMSVTQNRRLYLRADVPERHYARLGEISSATFRTACSDTAVDLRSLGGRLLAYGRSSADASPYIPVTFEFENRGEIIPGSYAEIHLLLGKRENVITLPVAALTEEQGLYFVYLQKDASCYEKRRVQPGQSDGRRVEILSGLQEGETVVTQGAMQVKLASAASVIPAHNHSH